VVCGEKQGACRSVGSDSSSVPGIDCCDPAPRTTGMVQTRVTLRPGMPCRKMLPVIGLLPKFAEPSVTLLPSELTLAEQRPAGEEARASCNGDRAVCMVERGLAECPVCGLFIEWAENAADVLDTQPPPPRSPA
jgi:hypothetical protein